MGVTTEASGASTSTNVVSRVITSPWVLSPCGMRLHNLNCHDSLAARRKTHHPPHLPQRRPECGI